MHSKEFEVLVSIITERIIKGLDEEYNLSQADRKRIVRRILNNELNEFVEDYGYIVTIKNGKKYHTKFTRDIVTEYENLSKGSAMGSKHRGAIINAIPVSVSQINRNPEWWEYDYCKTKAKES